METKDPNETGVKHPNWITHIETLYKNNDQVYLEQINQILENEKCDVVIVDGGTETGVSFYELLIKGEPYYTIDVSGQMTEDTLPVRFKISSLAVYFGTSISEENKIYDWNKLD